MLNKMSPSMVLLLVNWVTEALLLAASSAFKILLCGCYKEVTTLNMVPLYHIVGKFGKHYNWRIDQKNVIGEFNFIWRCILLQVDGIIVFHMLDIYSAV